MINHILIGLGGTGGKVMAAFRRTLHDLEGTAEPATPALGYLYVDSSPDYFNREHDLWRIPGGSLYMGDACTLNIQGQDLQNTLNNVNRFPQIKPWIGDPSKWSHIQAAISSGFGGQKRRLGRFVFARQAADFARKVDEQYRVCTGKSQASETVFHIITGLAGGTGSGCVVDAISQIRKTYKTFKQHRIFVYALLPDIPSAWYKSGTSYYANGYAALMELNALAVGNYKPFDLTGNAEERVFLASGAMKDSQQAPPFDGCYVFTNENEKSRVIDITKRGDFYAIVGDFLYQKIIAVDDHAWQDNLSKFETMENLKSDPSEAEAGVPLRSMRFASFGIKRIVIPEREIKEYLVFSSARQAVLQSLFNHLTDNGYAESNSPYDYKPDDESKRRALRDTWRISEEHLRQEFSVLDLDKGQPTYKAYKEEWGLADRLVKMAKEGSATPNEWLSRLNKICNDRFEKDFRGVGVANFFELRGRELGQQVKKITDTIEADLFAKWQNGDWGLVTCHEALGAEIRWLSDIREKNAADIRKLKETLGNEKKRSDLDRLREANTKEWSKIGPLSALFGKREELLTAQASLFMTFYRYRTMLLGCEHAEKLVVALSDRLVELQDAIGSVINLHKQAYEGSNADETHKGIKAHIEARCEIKGEEPDLGAPVVKYYKPQDVQDFVKNLFKDKETCKVFASNYRRSVSKLVGAQKGFFSFKKQADLRKIEDAATDGDVESLVSERHALQVQRTPGAEGILGQNIVEKIGAGLTTDTMLARFCHEVISRAGTFLRFDDHQVKAKEDGTKPRNDDSGTYILMPPAPNNLAFEAQLKSALLSEDPKTVAKAIIEGRKPQEIVIISMRNLFPLRYAQPVIELRRKYNEYLLEAQTDDERERALMELHGEDRQFPPLFTLDAGEKDPIFRPYLLLGMAAGFIAKERDPSSGKETLVHCVLDGSAISLGPNLDSISTNVRTEVLRGLQNDITSRLSTMSAEDRGKCLRSLQGTVAALDTEFSSRLDPMRERQFKALRQAIGILEG